jgi:hypothetical protein
LFEIIINFQLIEGTITLERGKIELQTGFNQRETYILGQQAVTDTLNQSVTLKDVETNLYSS